jgi:ribosome-binding protein aMBF1 (putative translation factor)
MHQQKRMIVEKKLLNPNSSHLKKLDAITGEENKPSLTVDSDFKNWMIKTRTSLGWTRKDLGLKAGLSESVISLYETGKAVKNDKEMNKIQNCLNKQLHKKPEKE